MGKIKRCLKPRIIPNRLHANYKKIFIISIFFILLTIPYISNIQSEIINIKLNQNIIIELANHSSPNPNQYKNSIL